MRINKIKYIMKNIYIINKLQFITFILINIYYCICDIYFFSYILCKHLSYI